MEIRGEEVEKEKEEENDEGRGGEGDGGSVSFSIKIQLKYLCRVHKLKLLPSSIQAETRSGVGCWQG